MLINSDVYILLYTFGKRGVTLHMKLNNWIGIEINWSK